MRTATLLMVTLALAPVGLAAQAEGQGADARVQAVMDAAAKADIPLSLLQSKIDEGRAKGVSMDRIATALEARLKGLTRAQEVLSTGGVEDASEVISRSRPTRWRRASARPRCSRSRARHRASAGWWRPQCFPPWSSSVTSRKKR